MRMFCRSRAGAPLAPCAVRGLSTCRNHLYIKLATCRPVRRVGAAREGAVRAQAMFSGLGNLFKGDPSKKTKERLQPIVDAVNELEPDMTMRSDEELRAVAVSLKGRAQSGTPLDTLLPEAFAVRSSASEEAHDLCELLCICLAVTGLFAMRCCLLWLKACEPQPSDTARPLL
jgi:hypothetical protein